MEKNSLIALHCEVVTSSWQYVFKNSLINLDLACSVVGSQAQTINLLRLVFVTLNICLTIFCENNDLHFRTFTFRFSHAAMQKSLKTMSLRLQASAPESGHRPAAALSLSTDQLRSSLPVSPISSSLPFKPSAKLPSERFIKCKCLPRNFSSQSVNKISQFASSPIYQLPVPQCAMPRHSLLPVKPLTITRITYYYD